MALNADPNDSRTYSFATAIEDNAKEPVISTSTFPAEAGSKYAGSHYVGYIFLANLWGDAYDFKYKLTSAGSWSNFGTNLADYTPGIWVIPFYAQALGLGNYDGQVENNATQTVTIENWAKVT